MSEGSTSEDSTNCRLKIFGKKFQQFPKTKLEFAATIYIAFTLY